MFLAGREHHTETASSRNAKRRAIARLSLVALIALATSGAEYACYRHEICSYYIVGGVTFFLGWIFLEWPNWVRGAGTKDSILTFESKLRVASILFIVLSIVTPSNPWQHAWPSALSAMNFGIGITQTLRSELLYNWKLANEI